LLTLKFTDFTNENDNYAIKILGKGSVERVVYIALSIFEVNYEYLSNWYGLRSEFIISSTKGNFTKMNRSSLYTLIERVLSNYGINQRGIHIFRHTFARDCLQNKGFDLPQVQYLLGHKSIIITNKYYAQYNSKVKVAAANAFATQLQNLKGN